jgi:hypothetical protein
MPDLDLVTANGPLRVFSMLHGARPVLLNLGEPGGFDITPWADRVQLIDAKYVGTWELPVLGAVTASVLAVGAWLAQARRTYVPGDTRPGVICTEVEVDRMANLRCRGLPGRAASSSTGVALQHRVGESRPGLQGPRAEFPVGESDRRQRGLGVHPQEAAGPAEMTERGW